MGSFSKRTTQSHSFCHPASESTTAATRTATVAIDRLVSWTSDHPKGKSSAEETIVHCSRTRSRCTVHLAVAMSASMTLREARLPQGSPARAYMLRVQQHELAAAARVRALKRRAVWYESLFCMCALPVGLTHALRTWIQASTCCHRS